MYILNCKKKSKTKSNILEYKFCFELYCNCYYIVNVEYKTIQWEPNDGHILQIDILNAHSA